MINDNTERARQTPESDKPRTVDDRLSADLGIDVAAVEAQARLHLDLLRMQRREPGELGYVLIDREFHPRTAVVFASPTEARSALEGHPSELRSPYSARPFYEGSDRRWQIRFPI